MATRKIEVQILGDSSKLERAFGNASNSTKGFGSKIGGGLMTLAKGAAVAGAAVGGGLVVALKSGIDQMNQQAAASAQTAAVLKSTGGAAHVTQKGVEGLAGALQAQTGIADDSIQAGENMLLTFTNVHNEAGKGNDIFNQSTKVLADMSTAMGTDMSKQAIQLGKALNDPIKGVSALSKVGVTFTDGQKASIKAMVESGNTMGAQKVILAELNKEFGGSAKAFGDTFPGQIEKTKRSFENVTQSLAEALLPTLTRALDFINATVIPGFQSLVSWGQAHWPQFRAAAEQAFDWFKTTLGPLVTGAIAVATAAFESIVAWGRQHWPEIKATAITAFNELKAAISGVVTFLQALWQRFGSDILNVARTAFQGIYNAIGPILSTIKAIIDTFLAALRGDWSGVWDGLKAIVDNALKAVVAIIKGLVTVFAAAMKLLAHAALDAFVAILSGLAGVAKAAVMNGVKAVAGLVGAAAAAAGRLGKAIVTGILDALKGLAALASRIVQNISGGIAKAASWAATTAAGIGRSIVTGIWNGISGAAGWLADKIRSFVGSGITGIIKSVLGIGSPSKVMADQVGRPLAEGISMGFWAGSDAMEKKVKDRLALVTAGLEREATAAGERTTAALAAGMANAAAANAAAISRNLQPLQDAIAKFDAQVANRTFTRQMEDLTAASLAARDALFAVQSNLGLATSDKAFTGDTSAFLAEDLAALRAAEQTFQRAEEDRAALSAAQLRTAWQNQLDALPHLAEGGIVRKPTLAVIGESGPEVVSPLGGRGTGGINLTVNNYGNHLDELSMAARLSWQLRTAMG